MARIRDRRVRLAFSKEVNRSDFRQVRRRPRTQQDSVHRSQAEARSAPGIFAIFVVVLGDPFSHLACTYAYHGSAFVSYPGSRPKTSAPSVRSFKSPSRLSSAASTTYCSKAG